MNVHQCVVVSCCILSMVSCNDRASSPPNPVTAEEVEHEVLVHYHGRDVHLFGTVVTTMGTTVLHTDFSATWSKTRIDLRWNSPTIQPATDTSGQLVIADGQGTVSESVGTTALPLSVRDHDPAMALAMATGASSGSAPLVHALWSGDPSLFPAQAAIEEHGDTCLLTGTNPAGEHVVFTIKNRTQVVHIHAEMPNPAHVIAGLTSALDDDTIRKTLINAGMPATDKDIKTFKEMMSKAQAQASVTPGSVITDTDVSEQPLPLSPRPSVPAPPPATTST